MAIEDEVRPQVLQFAYWMEFKLRKHDRDWGRAGWVTADLLGLIRKGNSEFGEYQAALHRWDKASEIMSEDPKDEEAIIEALVNLATEGADVANLIMMVLDRLAILEQNPLKVAKQPW